MVVIYGVNVYRTRSVSCVVGVFWWTSVLSQVVLFSDTDAFL